MVFLALLLPTELTIPANIYAPANLVYFLTLFASLKTALRTF